MTAYTKTDRFGGTTAAVSATATGAGTVKQAANQAPAAWADAAADKVQFDALLAKLKAAGIMVAD